MDLPDDRDQARVVQRPILFRAFISYGLVLAIGIQIPAVATGRFSLTYLLGGAAGAGLGTLISLAFVGRWTIELTDTYIEGPSTLRRVRIPLSDLNAAQTRKTLLGSVRLASNRGEVITMDAAMFSKEQRDRILEAIGRDAI